MQKTLGGDRLGSGKKLKVDIHGFERSTHNLSYLWRSTMSSGTLVPFLSEIALPGDTFDINLDCDLKTHPTIGPLFGSYKIQLDVFQAPIRLYNSLLHNNALNIGLNMQVVKFPIMTLLAMPTPTDIQDLDNSQINPSCILSYLGIRGIGTTINVGGKERTFNAIPLLAYWEIYKQYFANKSEGIGAVIHSDVPNIGNTVTSIEVYIPGIGVQPISQAPFYGPSVTTQNGSILYINYSASTPMDPSQIILNTDQGELTMTQLAGTTYIDDGISQQYAPYAIFRYGNLTILNWRYATIADTGSSGQPEVTTFTLENIDTMRNAILAFNSQTTPFDIETDPAAPLEPYTWICDNPTTRPSYRLSTQEGLAVKTYQSDMFNNWLDTEWIDGTNGINEITAIDVSGGTLQIDALILARKVYDMLNRIAVSGGTYDDWLDAQYANDRYKRCESPMYMGGLIRELVFQEVVSNSQTNDQPLGTLAGKGIMAGKKKGGNVTINVDEPSYIIGIISLTPRLDYSQGNKWDTHLETMNDLHVPMLDEIGFQELITEQMAWWDTQDIAGTWTTKSAGKQPAWLNYMTNINQTRGNFAVTNNEMFMTLNRRYEPSALTTPTIADLTTYIDPIKFNFIFAETSIDAQNFWAQISIDMTVRRKMSAKIMPNL